MTCYSVSPAGEKFPIPEEDKYTAEFTRVASLVEEARNEGKEIIVVMGVGFVGAVMAAIIADTIDKPASPVSLLSAAKGPAHEVIGKYHCLIEAYRR